jgi:hypothetical protein
VCVFVADVYLSGTQFYGPWLRLTGCVIVIAIACCCCCRVCVRVASRDRVRALRCRVGAGTELGSMLPYDPAYVSFGPRVFFADQVMIGEYRRVCRCVVTPCCVHSGAVGSSRARRAEDDGDRRRHVRTRARTLCSRVACACARSTFGGGAVVPVGAQTPDGMLLGMSTPFDDKLMCT